MTCRLEYQNKQTIMCPDFQKGCWCEEQQSLWEVEEEKDNESEAMRKQDIIEHEDLAGAKGYPM